MSRCAGVVLCAALGALVSPGRASETPALPSAWAPESPLLVDGALTPLPLSTLPRASFAITPPVPEAIMAQATERFFFGEQRPDLATRTALLTVLDKKSPEASVVAWGEVLWDLGFWGADDPLPSGMQDEAFTQAVQRAQHFYGLTMDGLVGPSLLLNVQENQWVQGSYAWWTQVTDALAVARTQGSNQVIVVNIPSYHLQLWQVEPVQLLLESRVIVGKPGSKTPRITTSVVNLKLNPDWSPPPSMSGKSYTAPGPNNPLGQVRFSTFNAGNIYLHDTNDHTLFDKPTRALSSGCVRVEGWRDLALLMSGWSPETLDTNLATGRTSFHDIVPVPVIMGYSEYAVVNGRLGRHPDVYRLNRTP